MLGKKIRIQNCMYGYYPKFLRDMSTPKLGGAVTRKASNCWAYGTTDDIFCLLCNF